MVTSSPLTRVGVAALLFSVVTLVGVSRAETEDPNCGGSCPSGQACRVENVKTMNIWCPQDGCCPTTGFPCDTCWPGFTCDVVPYEWDCNCYYQDTGENSGSTCY
jgi:hypothetical protein